MNLILPSWFNTLFHPRGPYHKENSKALALQGSVGWRLGVGLGGLAHAWIVTVLPSPCQTPPAARMVWTC